MGNIALERNRVEEAESYYEKAISFKQHTYGADFAEGHYALSRMWARHNKKEKAREELQKAMAINPFLEWDNELLHALDVNVPEEMAVTDEFY